jgi:hypothetical protein
MLHCLGPVFAGCLVLGIVGVSQAQGPDAPAEARPYVRFPFEGNLEALLQMKLQQVQGQGQFQRWLNDLAKDPSRIRPGNKQLQEQFKEHLANPLVKDQIEEALRKGADKTGPDPSKMAEMTKKLEQFMEHAKNKGMGPEGELKMPHFTPPGSGRVPSSPPAVPAPSAEMDREDRFGDWLRDRMEALENTSFGKALRESPAFQQALFDLEEALLSTDGQRPGFKPWDLGEIASRLPRPDWDFSRLDGASPKLGNISLPELPRLEFGGGGNWQLSAPGRPGGVASGAGQVLLVVLLLAAAGAVAWQLLVRVKLKATAGIGRGWRLGPWPVHPGRIASRADLVQAFEHLSLLRLGPSVVTWNHLALAEGLAGTRPAAAHSREAAHELAALYEQARYAPEDGPLSAEALAAARRDLCLLAGVAHE